MSDIRTCSIVRSTSLFSCYVPYKVQERLLRWRGPIADLPAAAVHAVSFFSSRRVLSGPLSLTVLSNIVKLKYVPTQIDDRPDLYCGSPPPIFVP